MALRGFSSRNPNGRRERLRGWGLNTNLRGMRFDQTFLVAISVCCTDRYALNHFCMSLHSWVRNFEDWFPYFGQALAKAYLKAKQPTGIVFKRNNHVCLGEPTCV